MLQLHLSDQQFYCLLGCDLYERLYSILDHVIMAPNYILYTYCWILTHWPLGDLKEILDTYIYVIFKLILVIGGWGNSCEIALQWMSQDLPGNKSTLVQVMAWCPQATSHYLDQCWPALCQNMTSLGHNELSYKISTISQVNHCALTYCGLVMPYGDIDLGQHWIS